MPVSIVRLRYWFAAMAILLVAVVAAFYLYARWQSSQVTHIVPKPLGITIQQTTQGFALSKSEGGRTLFTVRASRAVQFKAGGRAMLHDVTIVVYGKQANRFDQIYGKQFEYDPKSGDVIGIGAVHMDLQSNAQGPTRPDQAPPEVVKNPVHIDTSNLTFNQKTGNAVTPALVRFSMPQASGSAVGASYNAHDNSLTMSAQVELTTSGEEGMHIVARRAVMTKIPRQIVMAQPQVTRSDENFSADQGTIFLRPDNTAYRLLAQGNVHADTVGEAPTHLQAARGDFQIGTRNQVQSGVLSGEVRVQATGKQPAEARSRRAYLKFGPQNVLSHVHAVGRVQMVQHRAPSPDGQPQQTEVDADAVDFTLKPGNILDYADTAGKARIIILSASNQGGGPAGEGRAARSKPPGPVRTTVTARTFHATFNEQNRMKTLHGAPEAKIVSLTPGEPQRVSTSRVLDVSFAPDGQVSHMAQSGDVHFTEPQRQGWAQNAAYDPNNGNLVLTGAPRVEDGGTTTTADMIRMVRPTGKAFAQGKVKSTYSQLKADPTGAMLASSDPIHVTSESMTADRNTGTAVYVGAARLWQNGNIVQAPTITFHKNERTVEAQSDAQHRVATLFVQTDATGKVTPVNVFSDQLTYVDQIRQAHFAGKVVARMTDGTLTADQATVYLMARQQRAGVKAANEPSASQLDHIVADGHVILKQPTRRGQGDRLVYTAADGKYVLSGGTPSIFDAERGTVQGDSLTFYNRDDRVLVESAPSPPIAQSRVAK